MNSKQDKFIPRHNIIKPLKDKDREFCKQQEEQLITYKKFLVRLNSLFFLETMEARRQWDDR